MTGARSVKLALAFCVVAIALAGPAALARSHGPATTSAQVRAAEFTFEPNVLTIDSGTTVSWTNGGALPHDVVDRGGTFDTQPILPSKNASVTFTVPGTYSYFCRIHPAKMNATIHVTGAGPTAAVNRIQVQEFAYDPPELRVATGSLILLANVGGLPHTMTAKDGSFESGIVTPGPSNGRFAGTNVAFSVGQPGTYDFFCKVHPVMHGTLIASGPLRAGPPVASSAPQKVSLTAKDFAFDPVQVSVAPGGTLTWTNKGQAPHTATFDAGNLDTRVINPGGSASLKAPAQSGSYAYRCNIHPTQMRGVVVVVGPNETDPTRTAAGRAELAYVESGGGSPLPWVALATGVIGAFLGGFGISAFARNRWGAE